MTMILPVIHYQSDEQALRNAEVAFDAGCDGVFLIHMRGQNALLAAPARAIKARWPDKLVGVNYLGWDTAGAVAANIDDGLDMTWTDNQLTHSSGDDLQDARRVHAAMAAKPGHLVFTGVAFKHQRKEPHPVQAAQMAVEHGFIPTTSGPATGVAAEVTAVRALREGLDVAPLAIASGITPDNVAEFAPNLSHILVASGVSSSFYEFDFEKLCRLRALCGS